MGQQRRLDSLDWGGDRKSAWQGRFAEGSHKATGSKWRICLFAGRYSGEGGLDGDNLLLSKYLSSRAVQALWGWAEWGRFLGRVIGGTIS